MSKAFDLIFEAIQAESDFADVSPVLMEEWPCTLPGERPLIKILLKKYAGSGGGGGGGEGVTGLIVVKEESGDYTSFEPAANTDAARGTALRTAIAAATAGQTVDVGPGTFAFGFNNATLADGVCLTMDPGTLITSKADLTLEGPIIVPGNNSIIRGGTIQGIGTTGGGADSGFQAPIGLSTDVGNVAKTGIQVIGTTLIGDSDGFYFQVDSGAASAILRDCVILTKWDAIVAAPFGAGAASTIDCYNCRVIVSGPSATGSNKAHGLYAEFDCVIKFYGGSITVTGGGTSENDGAQTNDGGTIEVYDAVIAVSNGGNPKFDLNNVSGTLKVSGGSGSGTNGAWVTSGTITRVGADYRANSVTDNGDGTLTFVIAGVTANAFKAV